MILAGLGAWAHGLGGPPTVVTIWPARGTIEDVTGTAALRWADSDPDDNALVSLWTSPELFNSATRITVGTQLSEDCDPADGGPIFTGPNDAGEDVLALTAQHCETGTGCTPGNDCLTWDVTAVPTGVYFVTSEINDHWPDGGGGTVGTHTALGVVRVTQPGDNVPPALVFLEPDGLGDIVDTCFHARWVASDPDGLALLDLFLEDLDGGVRVPLQQDVVLSNGTGGLDLTLDTVVDRSNWLVVGVLDDGQHPPWMVRSRGPVTRFQAIAMDGGCTPAPLDAGTVPDAAEVDAAIVDAAVPDAAMPDAAAPLADAAVELDAGTQDAAAPQDAATTVDAAQPLPDASVAVDAANVADAATPPPPTPPSGCGNCAQAGSCGWVVLLLVLRRRR